MLRIATLNLNYRMPKHGAWEARRAAIVDALQRAHADVVALQAVEGADGNSQAAELAALLDYDHVVYVAAAVQRDGSRGSAFISRWPLLDVRVRHLSVQPNQEDDNHRVVIHAGIDAPGGAFDLYNAHFSWVPAQSLINARETADFHTGARALLLGDLNSAADSPALQTLRQAGLVDLWAALRPTDPGYTFEADRPAQRIDYALASRQLQARVRAIERMGAERRDLPRLSDHLGLLVTLDDANTARTSH